MDPDPGAAGGAAAGGAAGAAAVPEIPAGIQDRVVKVGDPGKIAQLTPAELAERDTWWQGLSVVAVIGLRAGGEAEEDGAFTAFFTIDCSFEGDGSDVRVVGFENPEDAFRVTSVLRSHPQFMQRGPTVFSITPDQLGHELATNKSRVTVMKDGRPEVEPGMDAAQVADAITNEHYNRYVLGIDSLPKPQPQ